jgi:hypothetical protein
MYACLPVHSCIKMLCVCVPFCAFFHETILSVSEVVLTKMFHYSYESWVSGFLVSAVQPIHYLACIVFVFMWNIVLMRSFVCRFVEKSLDAARTLELLNELQEQRRSVRCLLPPGVDISITTPGVDISITTPGVDISITTRRRYVSFCFSILCKFTCMWVFLPCYEFQTTAIPLELDYILGGI